MAARCVCGQSQTFPLCDGSHGSSWACGEERAEVAVCVVAGPHLQSLAERLAHTDGGTALHHLQGRVRAERLVVVTDGTDLDQVVPAATRVDAAERVVIVVDVSPAIACLAFPGWSVRSVVLDNPLHLWRAVLGALNAEAVTVHPLPTGFISHAVIDEPRLQPAIDYVRSTTGVDLFLCADSIAPGAGWRTRIDEALRRAERFVLIGSKASFASTYCAFEAGAARALGKPMRMIVLDGAAPPAFLSDVQALDIPRWVARRPWLSPAEALVEALFDALD